MAGQAAGRRGALPGARRVLATSGAALLGVWSMAGTAGAATGAPTPAATAAAQSPSTTQCVLLCPTTTAPRPATTTPATAPASTRPPTTTTTRPAPTTAPGASTPVAASSPPPTPPSPSGGTGDNPVPGAPFPASLLAIANSVHRSPPSNTSALMAALAPLEQAGMTTLQAEIAGMGQFPVAGSAYYTDDWLEPRPGPTPHLHMGDDIIAPTGTPLRAPATGQLTYSDSDPAGYGLTAIVTRADGAYFLMAHMSATVAGLASGSSVAQGQIVGFVGATGDATGPHCHFEVHPGGGAAVDPKPLLDKWQAQAIAAIPAVLAAYQSGRAKPPAVAQPAVPAPSQLVPGPSEYPTLPAPSASGGKDSLAVLRGSHVPSTTRVGLVGLVLLLGTGATTLDVAWRARRAGGDRPDLEAGPDLGAGPEPG